MPPRSCGLSVTYRAHLPRPSSVTRALLLRQPTHSYSKYPPTMSTVNAHIQVLGTGASELAPSFYLFTDSRRYLFNCGEHLQRCRAEFRLPLTVTDVFVTHVSWRNVGGFPGMAMLTRDKAMEKSKDPLSSEKVKGHVPNINLHGPQLVEEFAELTRFFVGRRKITLTTPWGEKGGLTDVYEDHNVRIKTVPLCSSDPWSLSDESGDRSPDASPRLKRRKIALSSSNSTAAFVCKLSDVRGKFDVAKAKALGIPPGPVYSKLHSGESVTTSDGRVVHSHEVLGPPRVGPVMIVVECPDESYVSSVVSNPSLSAESFTASNQNVALIVHMSPVAVLRDKAFQKWMASFGSRTKHLVLNKEMCSEEIVLRRFLKIQAPLHLMNPAVYHPLVDWPHPPQGNAEFGSDLSESVIVGTTLLKYHLKPVHKIGLDTGAVLGPLADDYQEHYAALTSNKPLMDTIESSRSQAGLAKSPTDSIPNRHLIPRAESEDNPVITFLGTGSATPTCYRNVSGILVQTADSGSVLLDCGEGSLSQIYRCFGKEAGDNVVRNISGVVISHIHGDHHLGLVALLAKRQELTGGGDEGPLVIAPMTYLSWLSHYSGTCQRLTYLSVKCEKLVGSKFLRGLEFLPVSVMHSCNPAYGVVMRHTSGWSIVYSGDTRPCQVLVRAGSGATVLIHEATFEDDMTEDAKSKMHCTFGEALKISSQMKPEFTLMTHFSSRYPRIPSVLMDDRLHSRVGIALDCMSVRLKELDSLHADLPVMKEIFTHILGTESEDKEERTVAIQDWALEEASA